MTKQKRFESLQTASDDSIDGQEDCIVDYLKRNGFIDVDFIFREFDGNRYSCDFKVKKKIAVIYDKAARDFNINNSLSNHTECLIRYLKFVNMAEMTLEMNIQESISKLSKKDGLNTAMKYEELLNSKKENAVILCKAEFKLYKLFNDTRDTKWNLKLEEFEKMNVCNETYKVDAYDEFKEKYCTRMYVVKKKLIDPEFYKVKIVEECVLRFEKDCDQILIERKEIILDDMLASLIHPDENLPRRRKCMKKRIQFGNYFDFYARIKVLNDRDNIIQEIDEQRQHFIKNVIAILTNVLRC